MLKDIQLTSNWIEVREWTKREGKISENPLIYETYMVEGVPHIGMGIRVVDGIPSLMPYQSLIALYRTILLEKSQILKGQIPNFDAFAPELQTALVSFLYNTGANDSTLYTYANNEDWQGMLDWWVTHYTTANGKPILADRRRQEALYAAKGLAAMGKGILEPRKPIPVVQPLMDKLSTAGINPIMIFVVLLIIVVKFSKKKQGA